jgi:hypothetical protein
MEGEEGVSDFLHISVGDRHLNSASAFWTPGSIEVDLMLETIVFILGQFCKIQFASFEPC